MSTDVLAIRGDGTATSETIPDIPGPQITFADAAARAAATPTFAGQLGVQLDQGYLFKSNSTTTGDWGSPVTILGATKVAISSSLTSSVIQTDSNGVLILSGCAAGGGNSNAILFDGTTGAPGLTATNQNPGSQDIATMANVAALITAALNDAGTLSTILAAAGVTPFTGTPITTSDQGIVTG